MLVVGVELSASAAALLALLLHRAEQEALAQRIGIAVDTDSPGVWMSAPERATILEVLHDPPPAQLAELPELVHALQAQSTASWQVGTPREVLHITEDNTGGWLRAAFSPDTLSSTTRQRAGSTPSVCAANR